MRKWMLLSGLALVGCTAPTTSSSPISSELEKESIASESSEIEYTLPADDHERIYLYESGNVPYGGSGGEKYAFLTPYLTEHPTGGAVIVFPGGGYTHLSNSTAIEGQKQGGTNNDGDQKEASAIAPWYNAMGISVFVLNYRTTLVDSKLDYHGLLSDATRAFKVLESKKSEYHIDHICSMGFSAGGHLALMAVEQSEFEIDDPEYSKDEIDGLSYSIDSLVLGYPVASFLDGLTHASTRRVFTGNNPELYDDFSPELHIGEDFPSTYLFHEKKDPTVPFASSQALDEALSFFDVDHRFSAFEDDASEETPLHGFGVNQNLADASKWMDESTAFLKERGF